MDIAVKEEWDNAKLCLQACRKLGSARPPVLTVAQLRGDQALWLQPSELRHRRCALTSQEYATLISWLSSAQPMQPVQLQSQETSLGSVSEPEGDPSRFPSQMASLELVQTSSSLPPCIAGRVREVIGGTQLVLEDRLLDDIPDVTISALTDLQLAVHLCQRRSVFPLQHIVGCVTSIECLVPLRTVMAPYTRQQEYVIVCKAGDRASPLAALSVASIRTCLRDNATELLRDACRRRRSVEFPRSSPALFHEFPGD